MHIAAFRIENYKSFLATPEVTLTPGFNVVVGQNNVGKTALIEALSLTAGHKPHRSEKTAPTSRSTVKGASMTTVAIRLPQADLRDLIHVVSQTSGLFVSTPEGISVEFALQSFQRVLKAHEVMWWGTFGAGACHAAYFKEHGEHSGVNRAVQMRLTGGPQLAELASPGYVGIGRNDHFDVRLAPQLQARVYAFRAERFNIGACRFGHNVALSTDATNLPEVLNNLQGRNPERFRRLNKLMSTVFPVVRGITVRPLPNDQLETVVWTVDPTTERGDLAVPLAESGTGIGQVLAILYVVLTAEVPQVILIDEPQSFLHPGAVRKLIEILQHHSQHQYIVTTHSPTALTAADPETLLRLRIEEGETVIDRLDVKEARDLRLVLADVGARPSDVFGADAILWVEGPTEELCFPKIVRRLTAQPLLGTAIVGVMHTADFDARRSEATVQLYRRLSAGRGLLPPAVGFIFDREGRSDRDREDLDRHGNVFFLPRRMYENYLLNPAAIAAVASSIAGFRDEPLTEAEVRAWLEQNRWNAQYFDPLPAERTEDVWRREVRGDRLLGDVFAQLSEQRVQYDKVRHGVALTDWLLEHAPEELREVAQLIARALVPTAA